MRSDHLPVRDTDPYTSYGSAGHNFRCPTPKVCSEKYGLLAAVESIVANREAKAAAKALRDAANRIYNGAGDPEQAFYNYGLHPWLTTLANSYDPDVGWVAAMQSAGYKPVLRHTILVALTDLGPLTHDQIIEAVNRVRPASDSGVRTRVSELVEDGLVEHHPTMVAKSRYGRASLLWRVVEK